MRKHAAALSKILWLFFLLWLLLQAPFFLALAKQRKSPIDFLAYRVAADALERGQSPYLSPERSRQIWRSFHEAEVTLQAAAAQDKGEALRELFSRPQQPGPYLYPPTLALLIAQLRITPLSFAALTLLSILGFAWLWLRSAGASGVWLGLVILSWDVLASLYGGNVELLLLFATLAAAKLLWEASIRPPGGHARSGSRWVPLLAAPLVALVLLIKPFYALFFVAFGWLQLSSQPGAVRSGLRTWAATAAVVAALVAVEVYRWEPLLRADALRYMEHALEYQWFVLPVAEQTPMSAWNRTPMQALISAGVAPTMAQAAALALWFLLAGITAWRARGRPLTFAPAFALAFVLLYLGRPVGWGLIYLELVLIVTLWPSLSRSGRAALLAGVIALMASHWWALALTLGGHGIPLFTLQRADFPWETWLVLPLAWLLLLRAIPGADRSRAPAASAPANA